MTNSTVHVSEDRTRADAAADRSVATPGGPLVIPSSDPDVVRVGAILTMYLGPRDLLVNLDVQFREGITAEAVDVAVERIGQALRAEGPEVGRVYIEAASLRDVVAGVALQQTGHEGARA